MVRDEFQNDARVRIAIRIFVYMYFSACHSNNRNRDFQKEKMVLTYLVEKSKTGKSEKV